MLTKSLIQFLLKGGAMFPPLFDWRPNYGGSNEDNGDLLQRVPSMHCYTQCPQPCSRPPQPTPLLETPGHSRESLDQSLVGHGSFLLGLGAFKFCLCLQESISPVLSSGSSMVGLIETSFRRGYAILRSAVPGVPAPAAVHRWPVPSLRRHSNTVLFQSLWGLWVLLCTRFIWALWASLECMAFDSKH